MKIVVTGGAGFIGAHVSRALAEDPDAEVIVIDDLSSGRKDNLDAFGAELRIGTVLDSALLDEAFRAADAVVHLAAIPSVPRSLVDPLATHQANATGTLQVLEATRRAGVGHVIVASSSSVYGSNPELPKRESMRPEPLSPYAVSKLATEAYATAYASCFGIDVLAFRFFNVFGPLQAADHAYAAVIPAFVDAAMSRRALQVHGDGSQTRDFTYVGTVAAVIADAVRRRVSSDSPVNLAFGSRTSLMELIGQIEGFLGDEVEVSFGEPRPGDVHDSQADTTLLLSLFPDVSPVPFADGLAATVAWFRERRNVGPAVTTDRPI